MEERMKEPWEMTKEEWEELLRKRLTEEEAVKYFPRKNIYDKYRIYHKRYGVGEESFIVPTYKFLKAPKSGTFEINQYILQSNPDFIETLRRWHIEQALKEGKPVPPEVLKDYPDLAEKHGKAVREEGDRTLKEEILNIIRTHKRLKEATPLFRELSEKYGLELYKILAELVRENKLREGITKVGNFRYWELAEEKERGKEEKKEAKPKEEAVVEKLAELIEEKERLERELAGETVEGKTPPERTTPISEEERVRERIEEELAKAEKNPDELIFPPPDIPLTFEQVAGLKGIPVFMREDSCFWVPRYVHTSESLLEQVRSEELFKDKFEVVKREIDLLICPKEGVKYGKDYVYHSLVVVYPPTIPQKPVGALFLFKVPRRRFAEILRFRKHVLERFIKGKKKERSREELDFAARVAEEILRRIRIREEISRRIGRV